MCLFDDALQLKIVFCNIQDELGDGEINLSQYATDGCLNIDSKLAENSIRPVAVGRKKHLFLGSNAAAERAAIFYSLFATCKVHNVNPCNWLKDVLDRLA